MILTGSLIRVISKEQDSMQKITPFLWFDGKAEEAMNFYVSIFRNSKVVSVTRYGEGGPGPKGTVMSATFELDGQQFIALNGGPMFTFSPAISFFVNCETQEEVDDLWDKLSARLCPFANSETTGFQALSENVDRFSMLS